MTDPSLDEPVQVPYEKWRALGILLITLSALAIVMIGAVFLLRGWDLVAIVPQAVLALFALQGFSVWMEAQRAR